jgi:hypothetical protein
MQGIEMVGSSCDPAVFGRAPVFAIERIDVITAFRCLDVNKIDLALRAEFIPVDGSLVAGNIDAADRIAPGEGVVELQKDKKQSGNYQSGRDEGKGFETFPAVSLTFSHHSVGVQ